jgi:hypothetical protein
MSQVQRVLRMQNGRAECSAGTCVHSTLRTWSQSPFRAGRLAGAHQGSSRLRRKNVQARRDALGARHNSRRSRLQQCTVTLPSDGCVRRWAGPWQSRAMSVSLADRRVDIGIWRWAKIGVFFSFVAGWAWACVCNRVSRRGLSDDWACIIDVSARLA